MENYIYCFVNMTHQIELVNTIVIATSQTSPYIILVKKNEQHIFTPLNRISLARYQVRALHQQYRSPIRKYACLAQCRILVSAA